MPTTEQLIHALSQPTTNAFYLAVTGDCHVGKTTWLKRFIFAIQNAGLTADGFVEEAIFEDDKRIGYDFRDLLTNATVPVARKAFGDIHYTFYEDAWHFAATRLRRSSHVPIIIVDELGRIEAKGGGIMPYLMPFLSERRHHLIASVRQSVLPEIEARIGPFNTIITLSPLT